MFEGFLTAQSFTALRNSVQEQASLEASISLCYLNRPANAQYHNIGKVARQSSHEELTSKSSALEDSYTMQILAAKLYISR